MGKGPDITYINGGPKPGDITRGRFIGRVGSPHTSYVYRQCELCKDYRWTQYRTQSKVCNSCSGKYLAPHFLKEKNPNWRGGTSLRRTNPNGYVQIKIDETDKFYVMTDTNGYVFEHRYVVAKFLGRPLLKGEVVHRKNHIRNDNRVENLELINLHVNSAESLLWNYNKKLLEENVILRERIKELELSYA